MRDRIKSLRKDLKLTQAEFAERLGMARTGYASIESGDAPVQERHIKLILSAFPQVSEKWLRDGTGEMFTNRSDVEQIIAQYSFDGICAEMMRTFAELGPEEQEIVLDYTRKFIANLLSDRAKNADENEEPRCDQRAATEIEREKEAYGRELLVERSGQTSSASAGGSVESA